MIEFIPTEEHRKLARAAAESRPHDWPAEDRWKFILPGQPPMCATWQPDPSAEELRHEKVETGLCWVEDGLHARRLGFDWMLRVQADGHDLLVRNGRFFKV